MPEDIDTDDVYCFELMGDGYLYSDAFMIAPRDTPEAGDSTDFLRFVIGSSSTTFAKGTWEHLKVPLTTFIQYPSSSAPESERTWLPEEHTKGGPDNASAVSLHLCL